ncbi:uncharacterized protein MONOS_16521 [Monocercomonoides exilis]|uniref:uncharacterized protein n=1 Tax=Monocercomonoides exilis TaxID=2049356 RepID=UPI003559D990|nr:hypothetical protein MONOS_16521 [Monocercomonoides exilis]|eukprot:MONOS_16521.1-p1 / transcript=MONOS_16521.1 / gene=MONOS_16521 / organism=Monocercomonoides_exilis_PA203 / gene_product=unspecified product / transcript_product=unspecified product / location=Mono_scaffold01822:1268-2245(-) / protein_length=326 / sequence_SO=supercontig / SO=protein_coding / is_pseudo=false
MEEKTLNERIDSNVVYFNNYQKNDGGSGSVVTGRAVLVNKVSNLTFIDIDINKSLDDESKQSIRSKILNKLDEDDAVIQTASGGFHIYANTDDFYANSNKMIKCCTCDEFDVDIMTSLDESKRSLIVLPNSKVRKDHRSKTNVYQLVRGSFDSAITRNVNDILNDLSLKLYIKTSDEIDNIVKLDNDNDSISDELANVFVNGLECFVIHNDGGNMPINREVTFFALFQAINSLPNEHIELAFDRVQNSDNLTANARDNNYVAKQRYRCLRSSPFVLVKMYKIWNNDYYTNEILPLLRNDINVERPLDMSDSFSMTDIRRKAKTKQ